MTAPTPTPPPPPRSHGDVAGTPAQRLRAEAARWDTWAAEALALSRDFKGDHLRTAAASLQGQAQAHAELAGRLRDLAEEMEAT
jgi:hypothetical protein